MVTIGMKKIATKFNWDLWKFNDKLLEDKEYMTKVEVYIVNMLRSEPRSFIKL